MRWIDSIKEDTGMSLQRPSRATEDSILWISLIHRVAGSQSQLDGTRHARVNKLVCFFSYSAVFCDRDLS